MFQIKKGRTTLNDCCLDYTKFDVLRYGVTISLTVTTSWLHHNTSGEQRNPPSSIPDFQPGFVQSYHVIILVHVTKIWINWHDTLYNKAVNLTEERWNPKGRSHIGSRVMRDYAPTQLESSRTGLLFADRTGTREPWMRRRRGLVWKARKRRRDGSTSARVWSMRRTSARMLPSTSWKAPWCQCGCPGSRRKASRRAADDTTEAAVRTRKRRKMGGPIEGCPEKP